MAIELGANISILIIITLFESLLIIIPNFISSKIQKRSFKEEIIELGFKKKNDNVIKLIFKYLAGIFIGVILFFIAGYLLFFFKNILIENIFSKQFVIIGSESMINTNPINPNFFELAIILTLHVIIVGPCEESFFRGFILKKTNKITNLGVAIIFSSICFSLYHVPPFIVPLATIITFFGYYFIIGILLSSIYIFFNFSLITPIATHSIFNILTLIL